LKNCNNPPKTDYFGLKSGYYSYLLDSRPEGQCHLVKPKNSDLEHIRLAPYFSMVLKCQPQPSFSPLQRASMHVLSGDCL